MSDRDICRILVDESERGAPDVPAGQPFDDSPDENSLPGSEVACQQDEKARKNETGKKYTELAGFRFVSGNENQF